MKFSLEEIALHVDGTVLGDSSIQISEVAEIQNARVGSITFLSNQMYNKYLITTEASAIFVSDEKLENKLFKNLDDKSDLEDLNVFRYGK